MPPTVKAKECLIDVRLAAKIRNLGLKNRFRCSACRRPVKPHVGKKLSHFEHLTHNPKCSLSPGPR